MERCNRGYEEGNNETEAKKFDNQRDNKKGMNNVSLVNDSHLEKRTKHLACCRRRMINMEYERKLKQVLNTLQVAVETGRTALGEYSGKVPTMLLPKI